MSASRTLLRKGAPESTRRMARGPRIKSGSIRRRCKDVSGKFVATFPHPDCLATFADLGQEADYHATKGLRVRAAGQ